VADVSARLAQREDSSRSPAGRLRRFGRRVLGPAALVAVMGAGAARPGVAADKAAKAESTEKSDKGKSDEKVSPADKDIKADKAAKADKADKADKKDDAGKPEADAKTAAAAGVAPAEDATGSKRRGPTLLRSAQSKRPAPPTPAAAKPGEDPPPPSPLTMDALRQDMKRSKDSGGINPDAPARTKVEQVLAEMVKTRTALRDDTSRLENLTLDGLSSGEAGAAGAPGGGPAAPGAPGQPPQKNPLDVLAKALRGIKPDQAAPIVARIDRRLAATVLLKMPPVDAGKIMGALKPDVAAEIATEIAMRAKPQHPMLGMGAKR